MDRTGQKKKFATLCVIGFLVTAISTSCGYTSEAQSSNNTVAPADLEVKTEFEKKLKLILHGLESGTLPHKNAPVELNLPPVETHDHLHRLGTVERGLEKQRFEQLLNSAETTGEKNSFLLVPLLIQVGILSLPDDPRRRTYFERAFAIAEGPAKEAASNGELIAAGRAFTVLCFYASGRGGWKNDRFRVDQERCLQNAFELKLRATGLSDESTRESLRNLTEWLSWNGAFNEACRVQGQVLQYALQTKPDGVDLDQLKGLYAFVLERADRKNDAIGITKELEAKQQQREIQSRAQTIESLERTLPAAQDRARAEPEALLNQLTSLASAKLANGDRNAALSVFQQGLDVFRTMPASPREYFGSTGMSDFVLSYLKSAKSNEDERLLYDFTDAVIKRGANSRFGLEALRTRDFGGFREYFKKQGRMADLLAYDKHVFELCKQVGCTHNVFVSTASLLQLDYAASGQSEKAAHVGAELLNFARSKKGDPSALPAVLNFAEQLDPEGDFNANYDELMQQISDTLFKADISADAVDDRPFKAAIDWHFNRNELDKAEQLLRRAHTIQAKTRRPMMLGSSEDRMVQKYCKTGQVVRAAQLVEYLHDNKMPTQDYELADYWLLQSAKFKAQGKKTEAAVALEKSNNFAKAYREYLNTHVRDGGVPPGFESRNYQERRKIRAAQFCVPVSQLK